MSSEETALAAGQAASAKGKGKGGKGAGAKPPPPPAPSAKPKSQPKVQDSIKVKVRHGELKSAGYTVHTAVNGTRTVQWTDGTTRTIPKGWIGDYEELKGQPEHGTEQRPAEGGSKPGSNRALQELLAQHPELADVDRLYQKGVPIDAVKVKIQAEFGERLAFLFCECLADVEGDGEGAGGAVGELKGETAALHGRLGDASWPAPTLAAECASLARPGYNSGMAHEYLDADEVLTKKVAVLAELISNAKQFVIYAGAGLSTGAGISDYASRAGAAGVMGQKAAGAPASPLKASPSYGHRVIAAMAKRGLIWRFIQQNHDGLPQKAGVPQSVINEIHGGWFDPSNPVIKMSGQLRGDLFKDLMFCERRADLVLVLGSSLCGMNADRLVATCATRAQVSTDKNKVFGSVIVSLQTTPHDRTSSVRIFHKIDTVMEKLAAALNLDVPTEDPSFSVDASHRPLGADVDVFAVPYDAEGNLVEGGATRHWDLRPRSRHIITVGNNKGHEALILGKTDDGHYRVGIKDPRMVQGEYHDVKLMGGWWPEAAVAGSVPILPIVAAPPKEEGDGDADKAPAYWLGSSDRIKNPGSPTQKELSQKRFGLSTSEDRPQAGSVSKRDPQVADIFGRAWDELGGDRDKLVERFGLDPADWTADMDKDRFINKFT